MGCLTIPVVNATTITLNMNRWIKNTETLTDSDSMWGVGNE